MDDRKCQECNDKGFREYEGYFVVKNITWKQKELQVLNLKKMKQ